MTHDHFVGCIEDEFQGWGCGMDACCGVGWLGVVVFDVVVFNLVVLNGWALWCWVDWYFAFGCYGLRWKSSVVLEGSVVD